MTSQPSSADAIPFNAFGGTIRLSNSCKDTLKKDDDIFEFSPSPKTSYRVSYEKHPYTIGLSMFDDDSGSESDDDEERKGGDRDDNARGTTIFRCCPDSLMSTLEKAQAVTFSETTTTFHRRGGSQYKTTQATKALRKFASSEGNALVDLGPTLSERFLSQAKEASTRSCQESCGGTADEK